MSLKMRATLSSLTNPLNSIYCSKASYKRPNSSLVKKSMSLATSATRRASRRRVRLVIEIRGEPAFDFLEGHAFAAVVIEDLVAGEFADAEIFGLRMGEVPAADAARRPHGAT